MSDILFRERLLARLESAGRLASGPWLAQALSDDQIGQLAAYYSLLQRWNSRINLTGLQLDLMNDRTIDRLFVEPLCAAECIGVSDVRWADLGSGGGSPAIPLKVVCPATHLTMVESRGRKAAFLRAVVSELQLSGVSVANVRADALLPVSSSAFDVITIRAVRLDEAFCSTVEELLSLRGRLVLFVPAAATIESRFDLVADVALSSTDSRIVVLAKR